MHVDMFGPCLLVDDVPASARFYTEHLGFSPRLELSWFTTLTHEDRPYELGFVQDGHETVPPCYRGRRAEGLIIGLVVSDATEVDARLRAAGVPIVTPLRDEPYGQRHVIAADPNDILVDIVELIPPDPDWLTRYGT